MELKFLGRGSAFNIKEGNTSAYIKQDKELLLIDCGENIFERIINKNLLDDIKNINILITHLNSDHVGSLSSLIYYCYYIKKIKINVLFPTNDLYKLLEIMGHTNTEYNYKLLEEYDNNLMVSNIVNNIKPIQVNHINTLNCFGYLIYLTNVKSIYYSGDSKNIPRSVIIDLPYLGCIYQDTCLTDYEGNVHLSLRKLCEIVPKEYRNKVYCMHVDCEELIEKIKLEGFNVVEREVL